MLATQRRIRVPWWFSESLLRLRTASADYTHTHTRMYTCSLTFGDLRKYTGSLKLVAWSSGIILHYRFKV